MFYGRIEPVIQSNPNAGAALLAYVLVHEIGHVLSGVAVHTPAGVMRARWSPEDIHLIATHRLELSADDVRLIRAAQPAVRRAAPDSFPVP